MPKWKPLLLEGDAFSNDVDGLVGIEVLEYEDENQSNVVTESTLTKQSEKRKRKSTDSKKAPIQEKKTKREDVKSEVEQDFFAENMTSWSGFGIRDELLKALQDKKFFEPTEIQLRCLGPAMCGYRDILGAAETGSGKTLAFGIPIVNGILNLKEKLLKEEEEEEEEEEHEDVDEEDWETAEVDVGCVKVKNLKTAKYQNRLFALILTPTRELAVQVKDHLTDLCKYTDLRIALVVGGLAYEKQERLLKKRPEIVVATPGRLWDLIVDKNIHFQRIEEVRYLTIDETDRMLEKGHFEELGQLLNRINLSEEKRKKRQTFVFSATLTIVHDPPSYLKGRKKKRVTPGQKLENLIDRVGITNPKVIDITTDQVTAENLLEFKIQCRFEEKDYYLYYFISSHKGRIIIFCNSIGCVKRLASLLTVLNLKPLPLHANMEQRQRLKNLERFKSMHDSVLLATDVAARGLDIPDVDHVVHYQVPRTAETYVHRSGRTARAKNVGSALLLIEPQEHRTYIKLIHTLGRDKEIQDLLLEIDTMNHIKNIIHHARDVDRLQLVLKKQSSSQSWYQKAIDDMDIVVDEEDMPKKISDEGNSKIKRDLNIKQKQLKELLNSTPTPNKFSGKFPDMNISSFMPMTNVRRDKLKIPGAFVLRNVPLVC